METKTTTHHGEQVTWTYGVLKVAATVRGVPVTINRYTRDQAKKGLHYRVAAGYVYLRDRDGFRDTLKAAKDDGVARALALAAQKGA